MNLQERIEALETEFNEKIKTSKAEAQQRDEFPRVGDEYWYLSSNGYIISDYNDGIDGIEVGLSEIGNMFRTKEQAEFASEKLKVEAELRKFSKPFELGAFNWIVCLNAETNEVHGSITRTMAQGAIYFGSYNSVEQAIESVGEERIKKYILGVE